ncbi:renalase-like [Haliotis rufescens]|uniref:renalase-like n=1 Tax=Haliotis rufescens TaxID=6454 RepID=UPI00201EBFA1|nr:renalase-like [Haliotis rufescens]
MQSPRVAIVGGGVSGLVCAARLGQLNIHDVTVFDTGQNAVGGRCSSRHVPIEGKTYIFDHSAQYFTVTDKRFAKIVSFLHSKGAVKVWSGNIGHLKKGRFSTDANITQAFIGSEGMRSVVECLASLVKVQRPCWIGSVSFDSVSRKWQVDKYGFFDYLVVAHNGKCADKLMSNAGVPDIHRLLTVRFGDHLVSRDPRMQLCSLWVLLVAFREPLKLPFQGAHVEHQDISWIANNTAKLGQKFPASKIECWTVFSTREFGTANKVPQENIPPGKAQGVTSKLLDAFSQATGKGQLPAVVYSRVQLWGAAVPMNVLGTDEECVFDSFSNVGICGDWLVSPCIQGAALSGLALAERIHQHCNGVAITSTSVKPVFVPASGHMIGAFPTDRNMIFTPNKSQ